MATNEKASPDTSQPPAIEALGVQIGTEQNLPFSLPYAAATNDDEQLYEQFQEDTQHLHGPNVRQLIAMRRTDGQARALYRLLTLPIKAALNNATFQPTDGGTKEAEFITKVFSLPQEQGGMSVTFQRVMAQLLMGLFDGFSAFEQVFWMPTFGPLKGKYTLKSLSYRPSETVSFVTDVKGNFRGFRQRAYLNGRAYDVHIPAENSFYYAAQEEERKFYGVSYFQSAFYHYDKKVKLYFTAHLAAQRSAVGTRIGTVPGTATQMAKNDFAKNLSNLSFAQWMMMPDGFKVDLLKDGAPFDFLNLINHHNSQMSKSILAAFFDASQGGGSNDASLIGIATPGDETFMMMLQAIMDDIAASINHYILPNLIDWNFNGGKYPKFTWGQLTDSQKETVAKTFNALAIAPQPNVTPEFLRKLEKHMAEDMGLQIDYDEIDKLEQEQHAGGVDPATGSPLSPGQNLSGGPIGKTPGAPETPETPPAAPSPDAVISAFTSANSIAADQPAPATDASAAPDATAVGLSNTSEGVLLSMAQGLLDEASKVELSKKKSKKQESEVTLDHVRTMKALCDQAEASGHPEVHAAAQRALSDVIDAYRKGKDPVQSRNDIKTVFEPMAILP